MKELFFSKKIFEILPLGLSDVGRPGSQLWTRFTILWTRFTIFEKIREEATTRIIQFWVTSKA